MAHTPELGPEYLKDRLLECREKQNLCTDLIVKVNRAYSSVRQALRAQNAALHHAEGSTQATRLRDEQQRMVDEQDSLKLLLDALNVRRGNLARTSSDIRLLAKIIETERPGAVGGKPQAERPVPREEPRLGPQEPPTAAEIAERIEVPVAAALAAAEPKAPTMKTLADEEEDIAHFLET